MRSAISRFLLASICLVVASGLDAAETVKFKQLSPIYADGAKGTGFRKPEGVACRGNELAVADTGNGRILRYTVQGDSWTPGGIIVLPQLTYPIRMDITSKGEIIALDGSTRKVVRISPKGEFSGYVVPVGNVRGGVETRSLRVDRDDNIYLLDVLSARVLVLDPSGKVLREIAFPKGYRFLSDLALDDGGNIYLVDSVGKRVYKVPKGASEAVPLSGNLEEEAYFPTSITIGRQGTIFLVDQNGAGIVILGPDGSFRGRRLRFGWKEGFLRYPAEMCITDSGTAFIADRGNSRIDTFVISE